MAKPDPESALYRPVVFDGDYAKIGRAALAGQEPSPLPFDQKPDPKLVGEQAYMYERDQLERAARLAEGGYNSAEPWNRFDGAIPPGVEAANLEREQQVRALHGGLSDAPADGGPQATEAGNRIPVRFTS